MSSKTIKCPECRGSGTMLYERACPASFSTPYGDLEEYEDDCENCGGSGEIDVEDEDFDEDDRGDWLMHKRQDEEMDRG